MHKRKLFFLMLSEVQLWQWEEKEVIALTLVALLSNLLWARTSSMACSKALYFSLVSCC